MCVRKTTEEFRKEVNNLGRGEYLLCSAYKNSHTKVKMYHKNCGNYYDVEPTAFLQGTRCPYCFGTHKLSQKDFISLVRDQVGNDYTFMEPYVNNHTKLLIKHNKCGFIWKSIPTSILGGFGCPRCKYSKGELNICNVLDSLKIEYETPKKFRGLKSFKTGYSLRYDFYLPRYKLLIEYQGIQHYKANKFFGGSRVYQYQVEKDYDKAYYAFDHGYRFLSIKYSSLGNIRNIIKSAIQSECRLLLNQ